MHYATFVKEHMAQFAGEPQAQKFKKIAALWREYKAGESKEPESPKEHMDKMPKASSKKMQKDSVKKMPKKMAKHAEEDEDFLKMLGIEKSKKAKTNFVKAAKQLMAKKAEDAEPDKPTTEAPSAVMILKAIEKQEQPQANKLAKKTLGF